MNPPTQFGLERAESPTLLGMGRCGGQAGAETAPRRPHWPAQERPPVLVGRGVSNPFQKGLFLNERENPSETPLHVAPLCSRVTKGEGHHRPFWAPNRVRGRSAPVAPILLAPGPVKHPEVPAAPLCSPSSLSKQSPQGPALLRQRENPTSKEHEDSFPPCPQTHSGRSVS